jgi:hypothetical protein
MKPTIIHQGTCTGGQSLGGVVVSTVRTGKTSYETAFVVAGVVSEPIRSASKREALTWHDAACDFVNRPTQTDAGARRETLASHFATARK